MTLKTRIGAATLALATLVPATTYAQNSRLGWVAGPLVSKVVDQSFFGPVYGFVPESTGKPITFAPGETIARANFKLNGASDSESTYNHAVLTYAGTDGERYFVELTCNSRFGNESANSVAVHRSLSMKHAAPLSLHCANMESTVVQPRQKITLTPISVNKETGAATLDVKITAINIENPR